MLKCMTLLAATAALWPAVARADFSYPDQRPASTTLTQLAQRAEGFWAQRGVVGCPDGIAIYQSSLVIADGWADALPCEIWLSTDLVDTVTNIMWQGPLLKACTAVTHEVGHALGLAHSPDGVMAGAGPYGQPDPEPYQFAWTPFYCWAWSRPLVIAELHRERISLRFLRRYVMGNPNPPRRLPVA